MFAEDLAVFMNASEFGATTCTLNGAAVAAIFDAAYALSTVGPYGMAGTQPVLTLATASVPATPVGATAVVNGATYTVAAHEPDGTGISRLMLEASA